VYYHPDASNAADQEAFVAGVAADCRSADLPLFVEPLTFSPDPDRPTLIGDERRRAVVETARRMTALGGDVLKADRGGRIYVDTGRNGYSATFAAAYTVRARRGAPVSAPCTWDEVERGEVDPWTFTLRSMPARIARVGDIWADMRRRGRSLAGPAEKLRQLSR